MSIFGRNYIRIVKYLIERAIFNEYRRKRSIETGIEQLSTGSRKFLYWAKNQRYHQGTIQIKRWWRVCSRTIQKGHFGSELLFRYTYHNPNWPRNESEYVRQAIGHRGNIGTLYRNIYNHNSWNNLVAYSICYLRSSTQQKV